MTSKMLGLCLHISHIADPKKAPRHMCRYVCVITFNEIKLSVSKIDIAQLPITLFDRTIRAMLYSIKSGKTPRNILKSLRINLGATTLLILFTRTANTRRIALNFFRQRTINIKPLIIFLQKARTLFHFMHFA